MKNFLNALAFTFLLGVFLSGCTATRQSMVLGVTGGNPLKYISDSGERIVAKYYTLSDSSLDFVKVTLPGGKEYTLPRVMSASGVRYTDDFELVWWTKGNTAFAETRDKDGQWRRIFNCREVPHE